VMVAAAHAGEATLPVEALAPGVFHVSGHQAAWGPEFHGHVANLGFVIGSRCIAVIDSGGSATVGRALLATLRQHSTRPICYVINTHPHPDHVLGNLAFVEANASADGDKAPPVFVGHARLRASLAARAPFYLNALRRDFEAVDQTPSVPLPTLAVTDRLELDLGDRVLELRAWPTAHTDSDLTVRDRTSATLWLGDLVFVGHLPVLDGNLKGWLAVLQGLKREAAQRLVPGHGAVLAPGPAAFDATERYLTQLQSDVGAALDEGLTLSQTVARLGSPPESRMAGWLLVDAFHRRNVTAAYAELEWSK
jgi:quinoprotein relay system zinc metallohydrolase 2